MGKFDRLDKFGVVEFTQEFESSFEDDDTWVPPEAV